MIVAGITGEIGHGKTTLAGLLSTKAHTAKHFETWEIVAEVAHELRTSGIAHPSPTNVEAINIWLRPLVDAIQFSTHEPVTFADIKLTPERLAKHPELYKKLFDYLKFIAKRPELAQTEITTVNKELFRPLLQWLGGYLVAQVGNGVWYNEIARRITYLKANSYDLVTVGGVRYPADAEHLRNIRGVVLEINRPGIGSRDTTDITERERNLIVADVLIVNNADLAALTKLAAVLYKDLLTHNLQAQYHSSDYMS